MSEVLDNLFQTRDPKQFVKLFKECEGEFGDPQNLLQHVATKLPRCFYEFHYDLHVPHGVFGLTAAAAAQPLFPEEKKWWPSLQHLWLIAHEQKRMPLILGKEKITGNGDPQSLWEVFREGVSNHEFDGAYQAASRLCQDAKTRSDFHHRSLRLASRDTAQGGLKLLYLSQSWRLAEALGWQGTEEVLFPALHFLILGPRDQSLAQEAETPPARQLLGRFDQNREPLGDGVLTEVETTLLNSNEADASRLALNRLAEEGVGLEGAFEALLITAAQALNNAQSGRWHQPLKALLFSYALSPWAPGAKAEEASPGLMIAAALIHRASRSSRESESNRDLSELGGELNPEEIFTLFRELVGYSDPFAAASAASRILKTGQGKELFENLATLAAKNDGRIGKGYDLLLVEACAKSFENASSRSKAKLPIACAFFLGRLLKNYDLIGAYGV